MKPRLVQQRDAITDVKSRLSMMGYMQIEKEIGGTTYWSRRRFFHKKIRVSTHQWSKGGRREDVVASIEITGPTIVEDITYQVRAADKAFLRECHARRVALG